MMKFILGMIFCLCSQIAMAQIGVGGGCIVDGNLCEEEDYRHLTAVSVSENVTQLAEKSKALPGLSILLRKIARSKDWLLDDRNFNPVLCGPQSISENPKDFQIVACQLVDEVRISKTFWETASPDQKNDLILHELILAYFMDQKMDLLAARRGTYLIKLLLQNQSDEFKVIELRNKLHSLGLPLLNVKGEDAFIYQFLKTYFMNNESEDFCISTTNSEELIRQWNIYYSSKVDNRFLYRRDLNQIGEKILLSLTKENKGIAIICENKIFFENKLYQLLRDNE